MKMYFLYYNETSNLIVPSAQVERYTLEEGDCLGWMRELNIFFVAAAIVVVLVDAVPLLLVCGRARTLRVSSVLL